MNEGNEQILFEMMLEESPFPIVIINEEDVIIYINKAMKKILAKDSEPIIGENYNFLGEKINFIDGSNFDDIELSSKVKEKKKKITDLVVQTVGEEGKIVLHFNAVPLLDTENKYRGMGLCFNELTEEYFLKKKNEITSEIWCEVHEIIGHPIMILDKDQKVIDVNKATEDLLDMDVDDIQGEYCYKLFHEKEEPPNKCPFLSMEQSKNMETEEMEVEVLGRIYLISCTPIFSENGRLDKVIHIGTDVTEERIAKKKLERSEKKYRELFETSKDGIAITDLEGNIQDCNKAFLNILGYEDVEEIKEKSYKNFTPEEYHEMEEEIIKNETLKNGYSKEYEKEYVTKDGERVSVKLRGWIRKDYEDDIVGMWVLVRDITEQKEAKEREEFLHSLLRHDIKNKIHVIRGYHVLLEDEVSDQGKEILDKATDVIKESQRLIEMVRKLAKVEEVEGYERAFLDTYLIEAVDSNRDIAEENGFTIDIIVDSHEVRGGPLLGELFSNIISNAVEHSGGDEIKIESIERENRVIVRIEDNGKGIEKEEKEKVFDRGYKEIDSEGTGLGLFLSKRIVESYDGEINVKDSDMGGACFEIILRKI